MISMSTGETATMAAPGQASRLRLKVADGGGTLQDLSNFQGRDWLLAVKMTKGIDQRFARCTAHVLAQIDRISLAELRSDSKANQVSGSYSPLLFEGRVMVVEACSIPVESGTPATGDWHEVFRGHLTSVILDGGGGGSIQLDGWDDAHQLVMSEHFLEYENIYGSGAGVAVETVMQSIIDDSYGKAWSSGWTVAQYDRAHKVVSNGYWYWATVAGTTGGAEPAWPVVIGNTVVDNTVTWKCMGTILQLYTPVSPAWAIAPSYNQKRVSCYEALEHLAQQLGWALEYRWDSGTSAFRFTLLNPDRAKAVADYTWYPDTTDTSGTPQPSFLEIPSSQQAIYDVRNVIEVQYSDRADLDSAGVPKRKAVTRRDGTSILAYGRKWMSIAVGSMDQIDTAAEAQAVGDNILSDLKDPYATHEIRCPLFWPVELGDLYTIKANRLMTADQTAAVVEFTHEWQAGKAPSTTIRLRGKPSAGFSRWKKLDTKVRALTSAPMAGPEQPTNVAVTKTQGGLAVTWDAPTNGRLAESFEVHVSTSAGFTPSSATLAAVVASTSKQGGVGYRKELSNLSPGTAYYVQVVPRTAMANQGTASAEVSLAAGYTTPLAMQPQVTSLMPRNPDFEAWNNGSSYPPDRWTFSGVWGVDGLQEAATVQTGSYAVRIPVAAGAQYLRSELLPVTPDADYYVEAWLKSMDAPFVGSTYVAIEWCLSDGTVSSTVPFGHPINPPPAKFIRHGGHAMCPSGIRLARVKVGTTGGSGDAYIDSSRLDRVVPSNPPSAGYYRSAVQAIPNAAITVVDYDTSQWDSHAAVTTGAAWNFTVPVGTYDAAYGAGRYLVTAMAQLPNAVAGLGDLYLYVNGALTRMLDSKDLAAAPVPYLHGSAVVGLVDGDTVDIRVYQTSGGALNLAAGAIYSWVQITRLAHTP